MEIRPILSALLRSKTGPVLVAIQVALSMAILANALHVVNVRQQISARPSGVEDEQSVIFMRVRNLDKPGPEGVIANREHELAVLRAVPGVASVAEINQIPLTRSGSSNSFVADRKQLQQVGSAATYDTPGGLVKTWGLKLVEGRDFVPGDFMNFDPEKDTDGPRNVIITTTMAKKLFPDGHAVGKIMYNGTGEGAFEMQVIGVVERLQAPWAQTDESGEYSEIRPMRHLGSNSTFYTLRVEPGQLERVMREAEEALRRGSPVPKIIKSQGLAQQRVECYRGDRALSLMLIAVSSLLLLITSSGIVGMASLWVTQRRKQIGVRRALGARKADILRYFVTENLLITSGGVFAGVLLALAMNDLMVRKLEMARLPPGYLVAGAGLLWALGIAAVYGPAWRAASISPATATRTT